MLGTGVNLQMTTAGDFFNKRVSTNLNALNNVGTLSITLTLPYDLEIGTNYKIVLQITPSSHL